MDRRSVKRGKVGSSSPWDRWLKQFEENKNKSSRKFILFRRLFINISRSEQVMSVYQKLGYYKAVDKINELYSDEKISLIQKSTLNNEITEWQMMSSKQRKWHNKL